MAKAKKSNKTAHVLNLLTTQNETKSDDDASDVVPSSEPDASPPAAPPPLPPPIPAPAPQPPADNTPKKVIKIENKSSDLLSEVIKLELEKQFATSLQQDSTVGDLLLYSSEDTSLGKDSNMTENIHTNDSGYVSVNIVEDLVKAKAPEYVKMLGGCSCYRCINDVIAVALNILPPKYIVTEKGLLLAKLATYENQYSADLVSALTKACMLVKDSPRH